MLTCISFLSLFHNELLLYITDILDEYLKTKNMWGHCWCDLVWLHCQLLSYGKYPSERAIGQSWISVFCKKPKPFSPLSCQVSSVESFQHCSASQFFFSKMTTHAASSACPQNTGCIWACCCSVGAVEGMDVSFLSQVLYDSAEIWNETGTATKQRNKWIKFYFLIVAFECPDKRFHTSAKPSTKGPHCWIWCEFSERLKQTCSSLYIHDADRGERRRAFLKLPSAPFPYNLPLHLCVLTEGLPHEVPSQTTYPWVEMAL